MLLMRSARAKETDGTGGVRFFEGDGREMGDNSRNGLGVDGTGGLDIGVTQSTPP